MASEHVWSDSEQGICDSEQQHEGCDLYGMYRSDLSGDGWIDCNELQQLSDGRRYMDARDRYGMDSGDELL